MSASALLRHGTEHATALLDGLTGWMERKGFTAVNDLRGMLRVAPGADRAGHERLPYLNAMREVAGRYTVPDL